MPYKGQLFLCKDADKFENLTDHVYIGVVRTDMKLTGSVKVEVLNDDGYPVTAKGHAIKDGKVYDDKDNVIPDEEPIAKMDTLTEVRPVHGLFKYYVGENTKSAPMTLKLGGSTACTLAGGPVNSKEGRYFLYYTMNQGASSNQTPITDIFYSDEPYTPGYSSTFSCSSDDRQGGSLLSYSAVRCVCDRMSLSIFMWRMIRQKCRLWREYILALEIRRKKHMQTF